LLTVRMISFCIIAAKRFHHPGTVHHKFVSLLMHKSGVRIRRTRSAEAMHVIVLRSRRIHSVDAPKIFTFHNQLYYTNSAAPIKITVSLLWIYSKFRKFALWHFVNFFGSGYAQENRKNVLHKRLCRKVEKIENW